MNIEESMARYLLGSADPAEREELLKWAEESPENGRMFLEYINIWDSSHPAFPESEIDEGDAFLELRNKMGKESRRHSAHRFSVILTRIAAVLAVPLAVFSVWSAVRLSKTDNLAEIRQTSIAPYPSRIKLVLADGSRVWLNAGSSLEYPTAFKGKKREVILKGEAYFEVSASEEHPFVVRTSSLDVVATGTEFNVNAYEADTLTSVSLLKGHLGVFCGSRRLSDLDAGERLSFNSLRKHYGVSKADVGNDCLWTEGVLRFNNESLEDVFKRIGQLYNIRFEIADPLLKGNLLRGTFDGESVGEILNIISMTTPIRYESDSLSHPRRIRVLRAK